jgi:hypothetical protein
MAKTQADRAREYRQRKRDAVTKKSLENVTRKCDTWDENVTNIECDAPSVTGAKNLTFHDLPADVQASIEHYCSENNDGARAGSHSRGAMTERALGYHRLFGRTSRATGKCQACGGPVQHVKIVKCLKCCTGTSAPSQRVRPKDYADLLGSIEDKRPLSVYSPARWAYLQGKGHVWDDMLKCSSRPGPHGGQIIGVPVPGDPAYETAYEKVESQGVLS